jgi:hypothetical protein
MNNFVEKDKTSAAVFVFVFLFNTLQNQPGTT